MHLSTEQHMASGLGWNLLKTRREKHNHHQVSQELSWWTSPKLFVRLFSTETYDVHAYYTRSKNKYLLIKSLPNRLREPSFIRALPISMILYNFIPVSYIVFLNRTMFIAVFMTEMVILLKYVIIIVIVIIIINFFFFIIKNSCVRKRIVVKWLSKDY